MLVLKRRALTLVLAGTHCQVVRNDKAERNGVGLASLKDAALGNVQLGERHAKLQEWAGRAARVLLDKVETGGSNAGKDNVEEVKNMSRVGWTMARPEMVEPDVYTFEL